MKTWNERLVESMNAAGISGGELARRIGVAQPSVFDWTTGATKSLRTNNLVKVADALGVSPDWLATGKGARDLNGGLPAAPALTPREIGLLALFNGLTASQQDEMMRKFEAEKQRNDALIDELMTKRRA
jgi:transcriptional regulator with XRE-family HTH domain